MPSGGDDSGRGNGPSGQSSTGNESTDSSSPGGKGSSGSSSGSSGKGSSGGSGGWGGGFGSTGGNANSPNAGGGRTASSNDGGLMGYTDVSNDAPGSPAGSGASSSTGGRSAASQGANSDATYGGAGGWGGGVTGNANSPNAGGGRISVSNSVNGGVGYDFAPTDMSTSGVSGARSGPSPTAGGFYAGGLFSAPAGYTPTTPSYAAMTKSYGEMADTATSVGVMGLGGTKSFDTVGGRYTGVAPHTGTSASARADVADRIADSRAETMAQAAARDETNNAAYSRFHTDYQQKAGMPTNQGLFAAFSPEVNGRQVGFTQNAYDLKKSDFVDGQMALDPVAPTNFSGVNPQSTDYATTQTQNAEQAASMGVVGKSSAPDLSKASQVISKYEGAKQGYNTVFGNGAYGTISVTTTPIAEILSFQKAQASKYGTKAFPVGQYQATRTTLAEWAAKNNIDTKTTPFTAELQEKFFADKMAERAGKASKMPGGLTPENMAVQISAEWDSMPMSNGKSYAGNNTHATYAETLSVAKSVISALENGTSVGKAAQDVSAFNPVATGYQSPTAANSTEVSGGQTSSTNGTSTSSEGDAASDVAVDDTGTAVSKEGKTATQKAIAAGIDVAVAVVGGVPGMVAQVAAQAIFGKTIGDIVTDKMGNTFTLNGDGSLTPTDQNTAPDGAGLEWDRKNAEAANPEDGSQDTGSSPATVTDPVARIGTVYLGHPLDKYIGPSGGLFQRGLVRAA